MNSKTFFVTYRVTSCNIEIELNTDFNGVADCISNGATLYCFIEIEDINYLEETAQEIAEMIQSTI